VAGFECTCKNTFCFKSGVTDFGVKENETPEQAERLKEERSEINTLRSS